VAELERRDAQRARHEARSVEQAREIASVLEKTVLRFEVKSGPMGSLFGSVTSTDVADELWRTRRVRVDRRKIDLHEPIKRIGRYEVPIDVFQDVRVEVKTEVVPEGGELPPEEELEAAAAAEAAAAEEAQAQSEQAAAKLAGILEAEEAEAGEAEAETAEPEAADEQEPEAEARTAATSSEPEAEHAE
jgi:large subunit ribosomal protein L9